MGRCEAKGLDGNLRGYECGPQVDASCMGSERFGSSVGMRGDARTTIAADCRSAAVLAAVYGPVATITRDM